jgi:cysteine synthase A
MAALGAELTLVPSEGGMTTKQLILDMIETARALSRGPNTWCVDQLNNNDSIAGYYPLGEEIWQQTHGSVSAFVHCVGTGASSRGVATVRSSWRIERRSAVANRRSRSMCRRPRHSRFDCIVGRACRSYCAKS